jgi:hypothetical protein
MVVSLDGRYLYVSLNSPGDVVKVNLATGHVVAAAHYT